EESGAAGGDDGHRGGAGGGDGLRRPGEQQERPVLRARLRRRKGHGLDDLQQQLDRRPRGRHHGQLRGHAHRGHLHLHRPGDREDRRGAVRGSRRQGQEEGPRGQPDHLHDHRHLRGPRGGGGRRGPYGDRLLHPTQGL
ncbi:MAG: hypothetical protein AVDCRST_MAG03-1562, partial [uncultured Rubrobacteraceae bacterium]